MQAVTVVVDGKCVFFSVECEFSVAYAVAVATYESTEIAVIGKIVGDAVVTKFYISQITVTVWHHKAHDASAIIGDAGLYAIFVGKYK